MLVRERAHGAHRVAETLRRVVVERPDFLQLVQAQHERLTLEKMREPADLHEHFQGVFGLRAPLDAAEPFAVARRQPVATQEHQRPAHEGRFPALAEKQRAEDVELHVRRRRSADR